MKFDFLFFLQSAMLGFAFAMDAFSVSLANGLHEPKMRIPKRCGIAGVFSFFQFLMPFLGWCCVSFAAKLTLFERFIPWIALALLGFIGGKMLYEGIRNKDTDENQPTVGFLSLLVQGIATSIDAFSGGFDMLGYDFWHALVACAVIAVVTFAICLAGVVIGAKVGTKLSGKAGILGGAILIFFGLKIFISSFF